MTHWNGFGIFPSFAILWCGTWILWISTVDPSIPAVRIISLYWHFTPKIFCEYLRTYCVASKGLCSARRRRRQKIWLAWWLQMSGNEFLTLAHGTVRSVAHVLSSHPLTRNDQVHSFRAIWSQYACLHSLLVLRHRLAASRARFSFHRLVGGATIWFYICKFII